jgi:gliding motility-associated-like protein
MIKSFINTVLMLFSISVLSQNLVPNSSFEYYTLCPDALSEINYAFPWTQPLGISTSDYFNTCSNDMGITIIIEKIKPRTGKGYAGCILFTDGSKWQEYVEVQLKEPLITNKQYCISMFVHILNRTYYSLDRIGALLTDTMVTSDNVHNPILIPPQVESPEWVYYQDTNNWQRIQGNFIASGGEKWLTIGNFHSDIDSHYIINPGSYSNYQAYYLVDDISVYLSDTTVLTANAGGNKEICKNQSITLGTTGKPDYLYWWYDQYKILIDSVAQITIAPSQTTTYYLKVKDFKYDESWDSTTVTVNENCNEMVYVPNVFSPNNDGKNDKLYVRGENISQMDLKIYNRWGNLVYETTNLTAGWDGIYNSKECDEGVYFCVAEITFVDGTTEIKRGNVTLVR